MIKESLQVKIKLFWAGHEYVKPYSTNFFFFSPFWTTFIYSGSNDGLIRFWETDDGKNVDFSVMNMENRITLDLMLLSILLVPSFLILHIFNACRFLNCDCVEFQYAVLNAQF